MNNTTLSAQASRVCPVCGSDNKELLYEQRFFTLPEGSPLSGYDVVICTCCGLAFADRIPPAQVFYDYYERQSRVEMAYRGGEDTEFDKKRFVRYTDYISQQFADKNIRILDIGCGRGGLLAELRQRGFVNVYGLDPSPNCARIINELYGIPVAVGNITNHTLSAQQYDLIIMCGVLEHLPDLKLAFNELRNLLPDGGSLLLDVPDASSFHTVPDAPFQEFSIEHIAFFAPKSLANLLAVYGFTEIDTARWLLQYSKTTIMPSVTGLFRKAASPGSWSRDDETETGLKLYIDKSNTEEHRVAAILEELADSGREFDVWGAGTHTLHLLEATPLGRCKIGAFIDSSPKLQGKELSGRPILAPSTLKERNNPIVISSRVFQADIVKQIRDTLDLDCELVLLYDV
ncbi:MAG: class I SAM-dependent methyltransferase [Candidatus Obscuribacterales bacterium]|nr:class I SAM-dependent methyltransferase [Candidatus Obscuribacterales bacterium]